MGYTTEFVGKVKIEPQVKVEHIRFINKFSDTRRMKRNKTRANELPDPVRLSVGLPIGDEGGYFVGGTGCAGQDRDASIIDYNSPPVGQPGLWCQWEVTEDGNHLKWNGAEKFYHYKEWLAYLIQHFFKFWGYTLNGEIKWQGEECKDIGVIVVRDNTVTTRPGEISEQYADEDNVVTGEGFDAFLNYATEHLRDAWMERNGDDIGDAELLSLKDLLNQWFEDKRNN